MARARLAYLYVPSWAASIERPIFAGGKPNVVDVKLFVVVRWLVGGTVDTDVCDDAPKLLALVDAVAKDERVKASYARA